MSDIVKLTRAVERLTTICKQLLMLVEKNRIASNQPAAHGYNELVVDTEERIEDVFPPGPQPDPGDSEAGQ